jgi:hypothetical protein
MSDQDRFENVPDEWVKELAVLDARIAALIEESSLPPEPKKQLKGQLRSVIQSYRMAK